MAWGILDRFTRPKWLLDRILLVADQVAVSDAEALPALLIETLREHLGAQCVCIHFADTAILRAEARETFLSACPASLPDAEHAASAKTAEAQFAELALSTREMVTASAMPAALQEEIRPVLASAGVRDGVAIPLTYHGDTYAAMCLYFRRTVPPRLTAVDDAPHSLRLLGNLIYGALLQQYYTGALQAEDSVTLAMAQAAATRDGYAAGHVAQVCALAVALGEAAGMNRVEIDAVRKSAMLRDIGKLHVPEYVLRKPGPLDAEERVCARQHPVVGERMLLAAGSASHAAGESLSMVASTVRSHHERLDGSGYPDSLTGSGVPALARIVAIADVFAALTADRPYRPALPAARAVETLRYMAGPKLDQELVALFLAGDVYTAAASNGAELLGDIGIPAAS